VAAAQDPAPGSSQWAAEGTFTPSLAADLIRGQFPGLAAAQVDALETGWDNTAFIVDGRWLFRFPRREIALPGIRREIAVLPRLAVSLPLPVPVPEFLGQPSPRYPWLFWGARLLPGAELAEADLTGPRRAVAAAAVGRFLRALHEPGLVAEVGDGLPTDPMGRASPPVRAGRARGTLDALSGQGIWTPGPDTERLLEAAQRAEAAAGPDSLVVSHGDLHVRHLLVGGDGAATGVIDWGDMCLADPAVDLSIAYAAFDGQARADLLAAYGRPVGPQRELAARVCALSMIAALAEYAAADGRPALLREATAGLRRVAA
jgi:aminoglycoside phosphotransferase (APT) family kinase protein